MSIRYQGGIISATPPTLVAGAGASGVWTLEQQIRAVAAGTWSFPPSYSYVTFSGASSPYPTNSTIGTITGTSTLSLTALGQLITSNSQLTVGLSLAWDPLNRVFVFAYADSTDATRGKVVVITPNSTFTSVSVGTPVTFSVNITAYQQIAYIGSGKFCLIYNTTGSDVATSRVGTVSGTSVTFGTADTIPSTPYVQSIRNDSFGFTSNGSGTVGRAFMDGNTGFGYVQAATISGTTVTWGDAVAYESTNVARWSSLAYSTIAGKYALVYQSNASSDGLGYVVTVSGTTITLSSRTTWETGTVVCTALAYDAGNNAFAILYTELNTSTARVVKATMGSTLTYSSSVQFTSSSTKQTAGSNGLASSATAVVGVNWNSSSTYQEAVIVLSGATPSVGSLSTLGTSTLYTPSIACAS